jgi:hypothetical protein
MDVITPLHNLPNLKKRQNGEEVALEICGIVLDVKAHLPGPKETAVSSAIVVRVIIIDYHHNCSREEIFAVALQFFLVYLTNNISNNPFFDTETLEDCY